MKIQRWIGGGAIVMTLLCSGCSPMVQLGSGTVPASVAEEDGYYPITIENQNSQGEMVEQTFTKEPERVVCAWQNSIETLLALGVGDRIVAAMGLPDGSYLQPEYREMFEKIPYRSMEKLDMETVMLQDPDFIVGWASTFSSKNLRNTDFWQGRGVHTYISPGSSSKIKNHTVEYEYQDILNLGKVFHREKRAEEIVGQMQDEIERAEGKAQKMGHHPRGLIIEYQGKDISVYGERSLAGNILTSMGGELLGAGMRTISKEQLIEMDPEVLFMVVCENAYDQMDEIVGRLYQDQALQGLRCVKEKRIYPLPLYAIYSAGVRTYDGIQIIGKGLYPEE